MSCPYFRPVERRAGGWGPRETMMPLGAVWTGSCQASPCQPWTPDDARVRRLCNLGYARELCDRFPQTADADAVRFTIIQAETVTLRLCFVIERDHHPQSHGLLDFAVSGNEFMATEDQDPMLLCQARAYVASYLALKSER